MRRRTSITRRSFSADHSRPLGACICALAVAGLAVVVFAGCPKQQDSKQLKSRQALLKRADRSDSLFEAVNSQLRDLPSSVTTKLVMPEVVLDSRHSSDGQDVMAICTANP